MIESGQEGEDQAVSLFNKLDHMVEEQGIDSLEAGAAFLNVGLKCCVRAGLDWPDVAKWLPTAFYGHFVTLKMEEQNGDDPAF